MANRKPFARFRWLFFREGFLYLFIIIALTICVNVPVTIRSVNIRRINDTAADLNLSQLFYFSKNQIPASAVDWKNLTAYFHMVLKTFPAKSDAEMFLGLCEYYGFGQEDQALLHILHSADTEPTIFWNVYDAGVLLFMRGNWDQSILYLEKSLLLPADKIITTMASSVVYRQFLGGQNTDLLDQINQAHENACLLLTAAHYLNRNYAMAKIFATKGMTSRGITNREPFYFYAGAVAMETGNIDEALSFFIQAIKIKSTNPLVYRFAENILRKSGEEEKAKKIADIGANLIQDPKLNHFPYPSRLRLEFF
ncbi:MAG: hypothetical protein HQL26_05625 [Candidatus Omnitrophica bacterium]|nr:hypothetical protein [Candidatus Omnitrophota bacterium]